MRFSQSHILSVAQFDRDSIGKVFEIADRMRPLADRQLITDTLQGAILNNLFFESSTRTRISFGCAFNLLGGSVRETSGVEQSSLSKGESLYDTARVLSGYSDIIVMRHPQAGSCARFAQASRAPVINAGDGDNEHPSQALLDLYTINRELKTKHGQLDGLRIALIGDLKNGRTVHSLCKLLCCYRDVSIQLISPATLAMPSAIIDELSAAGHRIETETDMAKGIAHVDIIYATRIQRERFADEEEARQYEGLYRLNRAIYTANCEPNTVIMHPLPRNSQQSAPELDDDLNEHPQLAIFRQTHNGLLVRMALFALIFNVADQLIREARPPLWQPRQRDATLDD